MRSVQALGVASLVMLALPDPSFAEPKSGGILRMYHRDSPGSASIHEGATYSINVPFMPIFNNLVMYDQHKAQNSLDGEALLALGRAVEHGDGLALQGHRRGERHERSLVDEALGRAQRLCRQGGQLLGQRQRGIEGAPWGGHRVDETETVRLLRQQRLAGQQELLGDRRRDETRAAAPCRRPPAAAPA